MKAEENFSKTLHDVQAVRHFKGHVGDEAQFQSKAAVGFCYNHQIYNLSWPSYLMWRFEFSNDLENSGGDTLAHLVQHLSIMRFSLAVP